MQTKVLISLAFLKVNWDTKHRIYLDNFLPFVAEVIRGQSADVISISNLQSNLSNLFGLIIPHHVIQSLLIRAKKNNLVRLKDKIFYRNPEKLNSFSSSFSSIRQKVERIYNALMDDFIQFAKDKYQQDISEQQAEDIFLSFISYYSLDIISYNLIEMQIPETTALSASNKIIICDYISSAKSRNPQIFDYIDTIVKGYMISYALYLPEPNNANKKFKRTKIFLDTSFIIFALGYSGEEFKAPCLELLDLLYSNNAQICCFRHTVEEIKGILDACSNRLGKYEDSPFGISVLYFTTKGYTHSDFRLLISQLERKIENLRIKIVNKPSYADHKFVIDEEEFSEYLKDQMQHYHDMAISRDVDSVAAIYRLRRGEEYFNVEDSSAIFVTTNSTLVSAANKYYRDKYNQYSSPPLITDFLLTNILWLKTPTRAPDLPMKRIVADCFAAIQPDDVLMEKWLYEIQKLKEKGQISSEDYYFMRFSKEAIDSVVEFTLGDPNIISEGTVLQILEKAKEKIREEAKQKLIEEEQKRLATEAQIRELLVSKERDEQIRMDRLREKANGAARRIVFLLKPISIIVLIALITLSLPLDILINFSLQQFVKNWPRFICFAIFLLVLVYAILNQYYGVTVKSLFNRLEIWLEIRFFNFLKSLSE